MKIGLSIGIVLFLIAGLIIGFFVSTKVMKRQLKKNPPISKDTIRMIYSQVGRKPTEAQVNEIFNRANKNQR
nr:MULTISPECIES: YneF family protein [Ureaplasma]